MRRGLGKVSGESPEEEKNRTENREVRKGVWRVPKETAESQPESTATIDPECA